MRFLCALRDTSTEGDFERWLAERGEVVMHPLGSSIAGAEGFEAAFVDLGRADAGALCEHLRAREGGARTILVALAAEARAIPPPLADLLDHVLVAPVRGGDIAAALWCGARNRQAADPAPDPSSAAECGPRAPQRSVAPATQLRRRVIEHHRRRMRLATVRDLTSARGWEAALRDSEEHQRRTRERAHRELAGFVAAMPVGVVLLREERVQHTNAAFASALGYQEPRELVGARLRDLVLPADWAKLDVAPPEEAAEPTGSSRPSRPSPHEAVDVRFVGKDERTATFQLTPGPVVQLDGLRVRVLVARDVTEERDLQARLVQAERMAALGFLASGVAHEINTPLGYTLTSLAYLEERMVDGRIPCQCEADAQDDPPEVGSALQQVREGVTRVAAIARDLRAFSRPGDAQLAVAPVRVAPVVEAAARMATATLRQRARLVVAVGDIPPVYADEQRLGQVILNLLVNAAHAMPEPRAPDDALPEVRVETHVEGGQVTIAVRDQGCGMPPAVLGRIFEPFFTTKAAGKGTGLGLSICHSLVTAMRGRLWATSTPGVGSTFFVALPAAPSAPMTVDDPPTQLRPRPAVAPPGPSAPSRPPESAPTETPATATAARVRPRVLVIDDEPNIGVAISRLLRAEYEVVTCTHPGPALERIRRGEPFDLVLCDLHLAGITGVEVHAALSALAPALAERALFLSGGACSESTQGFAEQMADRLLTKPFAAAALRRAVAAALMPRGAERGARRPSDGAAP